MPASLPAKLATLRGLAIAAVEHVLIEHALENSCVGGSIPPQGHQIYTVVSQGTTVFLFVLPGHAAYAMRDAALGLSALAFSSCLIWRKNQW